MSSASKHFLRCGLISCVHSTALVLLGLLVLLSSPSVTFCATWEPVGPEGGNFIFSLTNPANADEITAITSSPSPSNVYRSADGGASWSKIGQIADPYVEDVSAFDFLTLYAITSSCCYRSTDGGINWTQFGLPTLSGWAYCICAHPTNSGIVYAAGHYRTSQDTYTMVFFRSTDGGQSWSASQFFTFTHIFYPYDMAISNSNPSAIYICGRKEAGGNYFGFLFTTSDGGYTWKDISSAVERNPRRVFHSVAVDPTDDGKVYVGGPYFYRGTKTGPNSDLGTLTKHGPSFRARSTALRVNSAEKSVQIVPRSGSLFVQARFC